METRCWSLNDRPTLQELREVQRLFGLPDPALVEKDWLVVRALAAIVAADKGPFQLVFQGGTALSRAHRVIQRMSEDIDIKIVSEGPPPRPALRRLRESITDELLKAGFTFDPKNPEHLKSNYESRYTLYRLPYEPIAAGQGALRPEIQIETSVWPVRRPPVELPVISFVAEAFKRTPEVPAMACAAIEETAAEKFVGLTRRAGAELAGVQRDLEPTLVRHIHDLHATREHYDPADVAALAREIMLADAETYGHQFPAYRDDPLAETLRAVEGIAGDAGFASGYATFQRDMVYGDPSDFGTAIATLKSVSELLKKGRA
jgi:predicted nucleotidyltransferase component of viral defense system